ncbi:MAG TPA: hypothetical protein VN048_13405 [Verrucomicrobiae bacterium]|nr:hypothetical protein [Verrucomicrobiae bacterium]
MKRRPNNSPQPKHDGLSNSTSKLEPSRRTVSKVIKSTMKDYARTMKKLA